VPQQQVTDSFWSKSDVELRFLQFEMNDSLSSMCDLTLVIAFFCEKRQKSWHTPCGGGANVDFNSGGVPLHGRQMNESLHHHSTCANIGTPPVVPVLTPRHCQTGTANYKLVWLTGIRIPANKIYKNKGL